MTINEFIRRNHKRLNEDIYLQGLALGFWEAKFAFLEYKQRSMIYNKLSWNDTLRLSKNIHVITIKIIRQLNDFKPCNQNSELFKKLLLQKYKKLLPMTLEDKPDKFNPPLDLYLPYENKQYYLRKHKAKKDSPKDKEIE